MSLRCKFRCRSIEPARYTEGPPGSKRVIFDTYWDPTIPEDERFTHRTRSGEINVVIDNPEALARLRVGYMYYVDLTPAD